jgi:hypothetical protein
MVQFAEAFPDQAIVATLSRQLGWSHFVELLSLKKSLQRDFYLEMRRLPGLCDAWFSNNQFVYHN